LRSVTVLPALRENITLRTSDGLDLVGELARPLSGRITATLVTLHPLPTHGGFMDSHVLRKAAWRLPYLADIAVLRFNTRGTHSPRGTSDGHFEGGVGEAADVRAAVDFVASSSLPHRWLLGWSFGTELALMHGSALDVEGAILLSPPLHRAHDADIAAWQASGKPVVALVPEHDEYLTPAEARARFAPFPGVEVVVGEGAGHLWVGERYVRWVLDRIVETVVPGHAPLPTEIPAGAVDTAIPTNGAG
jgi:alpha/beta superfamily hydrolase